jgi:hypothetical protein
MWKRQHFNEKKLWKKTNKVSVQIWRRKQTKFKSVTNNRTECKLVSKKLSNCILKCPFLYKNEQIRKEKSGNE